MAIGQGKSRLLPGKKEIPGHRYLVAACLPLYARIWACLASLDVENGIAADSVVSDDDECVGGSKLHAASLNPWSTRLKEEVKIECIMSVS